MYEINTPNVISIMQANNIFAYCGNNPRYFKDSTGQFWDTIFDVISLGFSIAEVIANPTDTLAVLGLAGDVLDLIPGISGIGEIIRSTRGLKRLFLAGKNADDFIDAYKGYKAVKRAQIIENGKVIMSYKNLKKLSKDTGLEVHHLIEKRLAGALGIKNTDEMLSIAIDKDTHKKITKTFRNKIGYAKDTSKKLRTDTANAQDVWKATVETYQHHKMEEYLPELKKQLIDMADKEELKQITDWMGY